VVYTCSGFGATALCATRPGTRQGAKAETLWQRTRFAPTMASPLSLKPYLFVIHDSGMAQCLKADTGEAVWERPLRGSYCASPIYAAGNLYFLSDRGECVVVEAKPEFREVARNPLNERCQASPAVSAGRLFIRTEKALYCIRAR
jgi:outer membrane protein assembly factor BamB